VNNPDGIDRTTYARVSRDDGDASKASDWFDICGLSKYQAGIDFIGAFIDVSGSMRFSTVKESAKLFAQTLRCAGLSTDYVFNGSEEWIHPFFTSLKPPAGKTECANQSELCAPGQTCISNVCSGPILPDPKECPLPPSCEQTNTGVLLNTGSPSAVACLAMPGGQKTFLKYITSFGVDQNSLNSNDSKWKAGYSGRIGVTSVLGDNDYFDGYGGVKFIAGDGTSDSRDWVVMDWGPDNNGDYDGYSQDNTRGRYFGGESTYSGGGAFQMREGRLFGYSPSKGWKLLYHLPLGTRTGTYSHKNANWWTSGSTTGSGFGKYSDYDTLDIAYIAFSVES